MKKLLTLYSLFIFISCSENKEAAHSESEKTVQQLEVKSLLSSEIKSDTSKLKALFAIWQKEKIEKGELWAKDSCFPGWFADHQYNVPISDIGFPDSSDYQFLYADLNNDGKMDQLVTFNPSQCDGGNASMWTQLQVFTISEAGGYKTISSLDSVLFNHNGIWFYDSVKVNKIYGTYYEFLENDGHCCPSIKRLFEVDYSSGKTTFTDTLDVDY